MDALASIVAGALTASVALQPQPAGRIGATVPDPGGGPPWVVRTFDRQHENNRPEVCLQVGRLIDGALFRLWSDGRRREMGVGDRSVCGAVEPYAPDLLPVTVERLVDDPAAAEPRVTHTIVAGLAPVPGPVRLRVGATVQRVPVDPTTRTYLAVLPGTVRRADLTLQVPSEARTHVMDLAGRSIVEFTHGDRYVLGSARRVLTIDDPAGGRRLGLVAYTRKVATTTGPRRQRCVELGRVVGAETGLYESTWGSFLDAPTLVSLPPPEDDWLPVGPPAADIDSCTQVVFDGRKPLLQAFGVQRLDARHVAVHGVLARGARIALRTTRDGLRTDRSTHAFLAIVPSTGRRGERRRVTVTGPRNRRKVATLALGPWEWPKALDTATRRRHGRVLRVRWVAGFEPLAAVSVISGRARVIVKVSELAPPSFAPDGSPIGIAAIAISKCIDIRLPKPVGRRDVVDAVTHHGLPARLKRGRGALPPPRGPRNCPTVDANRHFDPPLELTHRGPT
ncbi:MAG TPA: hypothetical protein VFN41_14920 [Candidatus Limnocylindrales bacterium]|nr:hypothetical protein [Candidatus Limnocylindrales bacterium]